MEEPKIVIKDGGVEANITCMCGHTFKVSEWGFVYKRSKKGQIIEPRGKDDRGMIKCKCGREYIVAAVPQIFYKILNKDKFKDKKVSKKKVKE